MLESLNKVILYSNIHFIDLLLLVLNTTGQSHEISKILKGALAMRLPN
jgi:hypothetical protein